MDHEFQRSPSNIISKVIEKWDVQEREWHCDVETGQRPDPWEEDYDICCPSVLCSQNSFLAKTEQS
jgi:hypothetical protein